MSMAAFKVVSRFLTVTGLQVRLTQDNQVRDNVFSFTSLGKGV